MHEFYVARLFASIVAQPQVDPLGYYESERCAFIQHEIQSAKLS